MDEGLIRQWDFDRGALCFHCRSEAVQRIEVLPKAIVVTCADCGAERHYVLERSLVIKRPGTGRGGSKLRHEAWKFLWEARCPHCGNRTRNEFTIAEQAASIVCPACSFSRIYTFHAYSTSKRWSL
jgi:DNA-directed RNA polymerase subunit RPC12/RpoP